MQSVQSAAPPATHPLRGLTSQEAAQRAGEAQPSEYRRRTDGEIIRQNLLTFFNVILASLVMLLFVVGEFRDGFFVGLVVAANVAVGTYQEIKAVHALERLAVLSAPVAKVIRDGLEVHIPAEQVVRGDLVVLSPGEQIVADGKVVRGEGLELDESLLTGESEGVSKYEGDEVRSGSFVRSGTGAYVAEEVGASSYAGRLTIDARQYKTKPTPLQLRFNRILRVLLNATFVLALFLVISSIVKETSVTEAVRATVATVTTIAPVGLLLGITVAFAFGALRVSRAGALVQDLSAVEALNYVDYICMDKTGTITANRLEVVKVLPIEDGANTTRLIAAFAHATKGESKTVEALDIHFRGTAPSVRVIERVPFSSARRMSAVHMEVDGRDAVVVLGAPEDLLKRMRAQGGPGRATARLSEDGDGAAPGTGNALDEIERRNAELAGEGLRSVLFCLADGLPDEEGNVPGLRPIALAVLKDALRPEVHRVFETLKEMDVNVRLISGDNPDTVAALLRQLKIPVIGRPVSGAELAEADDETLGELLEQNNVFGRVAPEQKQRIVRVLRSRGHYVAMTGDGVNDVPALKEADLAVAMESGTSIARGVSGVILLNDSFKAFVAASSESRAVLGNAARLSKLFLAKSLYAYLLILATHFLGLSFPFLPRHGSLTALLTLGIPAFFISISKPPRTSGFDFTRSVLSFAIPAALAAGIAAIAVHLVVEGLAGRESPESRTLVTVTLALLGLWFMLQVLGFEGATWRRPTRPTVTIILAGTLVLALLWTLYTPPLRDFFDFTPMSPLRWIIVGLACAGGLFVQFVTTRYWQQILAFVTAAPSKDSIRGKKL